VEASKSPTAVTAEAAIAVEVSEAAATVEASATMGAAKTSTAAVTSEAATVKTTPSTVKTTALGKTGLRKGSERYRQCQDKRDPQPNGSRHLSFLQHLLDVPSHHTHPSDDNPLTNDVEFPQQTDFTPGLGGSATSPIVSKFTSDIPLLAKHARSGAPGMSVIVTKKAADPKGSLPVQYRTRKWRSALHREGGYLYLWLIRRCLIRVNFILALLLFITDFQSVIHWAEASLSELSPEFASGGSDPRD